MKLTKGRIHKLLTICKQTRKKPCAKEVDSETSIIKRMNSRNNFTARNKNKIHVNLMTKTLRYKMKE